MASYLTCIAVIILIVIYRCR